MSDATKIDYQAVVGYLWTLEARGRYEVSNVVNVLKSAGFPDELIPEWPSYDSGANVRAGMVISGDIARALGTEHPGSYGGWGFQHSANIRAIASLRD